MLFFQTVFGLFVFASSSCILVLSPTANTTSSSLQLLLSCPTFRHPLPLLYLLWVLGAKQAGFWWGLITSCVLCIAPPAPPPSGPPSTLTPGGSSTLSKKRPPPPPPGHKRTLSDPPSPLSHSPHSKGGLTGGETPPLVNSRAGSSLSPEYRCSRILIVLLWKINMLREFGKIIFTQGPHARFFQSIHLFVTWCTTSHHVMKISKLHHSWTKWRKPDILLKAPEKAKC